MAAEITSVAANPAETAKISLNMSKIVGVQELFLWCRVRTLSQREMAAAFLVSGR